MRLTMIAGGRSALITAAAAVVAAALLFFAPSAAAAADADEDPASSSSSSCAAVPPPRDACSLYGTADQLNDLFNAATDSHRTSGVFSHGLDCGSGLLRTEICYERNPFDLILDNPGSLPDWSLGWRGVAAGSGQTPDYDAACPSFDTSGVGSQPTDYSSSSATPPPSDYPRVCPTPKAISNGGVAFSYLRADFGTPRDVAYAFPEDEAEKARHIWGPGGYLLSGAELDGPDYSAAGLGCPELEPETDFWADGRLMGLFTRDAATFGRDACGAGNYWSRLVLGFANRADGQPGVDYSYMPPAEEIGQYIQSKYLENSYDYWCPASGESMLGNGNPHCGEQIDTVEAYYEHIKNVTDSYVDLSKILNQAMTQDDKEALGITDNCLDFFDCSMTYLMIWARIGQCSLDEDRFELYSEAQQYKNYPQYYKDILNSSRPDFSLFTESNIGVWNEAIIRSFHGVKIKDIAPHLVMYYFGTETEDVPVIDDSPGWYMDDPRTEMYAVANAIYANTGVSVPVVAVDPRAFLLDVDEGGTVQRKNPFRCGTPPDEPAPSDFRVDPSSAKQTGNPMPTASPDEPSAVVPTAPPNDDPSGDTSGASAIVLGIPILMALLTAVAAAEINSCAGF